MLLSIQQVLARVGVARSTLYEMRARGEFPEPEKLGPRDRAYRADVVDAWLRTHRGVRSAAT